MIGKILAICGFAIIFVIFIVNLFRKNSVSVPDGCSNCKYCEFTDKFDNGLPVKRCTKTGVAYRNTGLDRPINVADATFNKIFCDEFEPKER